MTMNNIPSSGSEDIFNKTPCFLLCDLQGTILFTSSSLCSHLKKKGKQIRGKSLHLLDFWTEKTRKTLRPVIDSFPTIQNPLRLPSLDYTLKDSPQKTELHIHPNFSDEDKTLEIYFSFPEDRIPDLFSSILEEDTSLIQDQLQCPIFIHRVLPDGSPDTFTHFNQEALDLTGYTAEELFQKTPYDISSEYLRNQINPTFQKLFLQGMGTFHGPLLHKNGKKITIEGATFRVIRKNKIFFISLLHPDIYNVEKKESLRSSFDALFYHSYIPVCERDFSRVNDYFNELKQSGVFDLTSYFMSHPEEVKKCISLVKTLRFNQAFMQAMEFTSEDFEYISQFIHKYLEKSNSVFCENLVRLVNHKTDFEFEIEVPTQKKTIKFFKVKLVVVPGHEKTLSRVLVIFLDLTGKKQIQDSLIRSEKAFNLLTDNLMALVQRFDRAGHLLFNSPPFEVLTGISVQDSIGKTYAELDFSDSLCSFVERELKNVFKNKNKSEHSFPFPLKKKDTLCSWRFIPELSEKGEVSTVLCLIRDVSFYKVIADHHMQKMEQLELAVKIAGITFVEWRQEDNRYYFGGTHKEIFGKNMNEYKHPEELHGIVHPEDLNSLFEAKKSLLSGQKQIPLEFRVFCPDGSLRWLKTICFSQFNPTSNFNRIIAVAMDLTSRKETEELIFETKEHFRQLTENINEIFSLWDLESRKQIYCSPAFKKITGYDSLNLTQEQILSQVICPEDLSVLMDAVNRLLTQIKETHTEIRIHSHAGKLIWLKIKFFPVFNKAGKITRIASLCTDITSLKEQTEREAQHREKMAQTDKLATLGMFISSIIHGLNNPLNYLLLNTEIVIRLWKKILPALDEYHRLHPGWSLSPLPYSQTRSMLPDIFRGLEEGAQKINTRISDLRAFIRNDVQNLNQKIHLPSLISSVLPFCRDLIAKSTSNFELLLTPDLPKAKGNSQQIEIVIMNLLNNSCQALTDKSQKIILETLYDDARKNAGIRVTDEGRGISKNNLNKIREPFFTTKGDKGMGLGLSIVASIMENHRGTLDIVSTEGKGTVVTVWLPAYY